MRLIAEAFTAALASFHRVVSGKLDIHVYRDVPLLLGPLQQPIEVRGKDKRKDIEAAATQVWVRIEGAGGK